MKLLKRNEIPVSLLPGRVIQSAIGKQAVSSSAKMTVGFAHYSSESGPMEPHQHAEEVCYIVDARNGWFRYGPGPKELSTPVHLEAGVILHNPELEWHVFEFGEGGYVDIIFFYGQVENIRPEEIKFTKEA
jgi:hypothetical protein